MTMMRFFFALLLWPVSSFCPTLQAKQTTTQLYAKNNAGVTSRRQALLQSSSSAVVAALAFLLQHPTPASAAATRPPLDELLYKLLRVREATQQETRLIKSGKFKDVQRANVKLAVRFILENYRLSDTFVSASAYLDGNQKRVEATNVGQSAVQNLYTILEYFDSADVQNIKVGSDSMAGKEDLVLKGLDATKKSIDDFLAYFPKSQVDAAQGRVDEENELNVKEFDSSLGSIVNMPSKT